MRRSLIAGLILFHGMFSGGLAAAQTSDLEVVIEGFRNGQGLVHVVLFNREKGFPADPDKGFRQHKDKIVNGRVIHVFEAVPNGRYAVRALHDEDGNGKMKTNFLGIPKEGFAVSNNATGSFEPPAFNDALFEVGGNRVSISMKMQY